LPAASFCRSPAPTILLLLPLAACCITRGVLAWRGFRRRREWWLILGPLCSAAIVWIVLGYFAARVR
jgi:hypothetical protein